MQLALVMVAPERVAYRDGLMALGELAHAHGASPPAVLSPWEAAEWRFDGEEGAEGPLRAQLEAAALAAGVDWALTPEADRRKRLLIADMDSTIIGCECLDELADFAGRKAEVAAITEQAMAGALDFAGALRARVAMLQGLPLSALEACFAERVRLNPGARTLVRTMAALGARCLLVSGGFTFFTERVAALAGFHDSRGNRLLDDGAALIGAVAEPILGREAKLEALLAAAKGLGVDASSALAIGDGANDLAMIEAAGLGLAYHSKPIVAARADAQIRFTGLETALFFQGIARKDFVD